MTELPTPMSINSEMIAIRREKQPLLDRLDELRDEEVRNRDAKDRLASKRFAKYRVTVKSNADAERLVDNDDEVADARFAHALTESLIKATETRLRSLDKDADMAISKMYGVRQELKSLQWGETA